MQISRLLLITLIGALGALGGSTCAPPDETASCLIDSQLASGTKSGYSFTSTPVGSSPISGYLVTGTPMGSNGNRSFCTTEGGVIYYDPSGNPIPDQPTCVGLTPLQ